MKENIKILLNRREEIKEELNKLNAEYKAIGDLITELYKYREEEKKREKNKDYERE